MAGYDFTNIERKWQQYWEDNGTFVQPNPGQDGFDPAKPKFYVLDMFPYPSGAGLHVGHPEGYTATDIVARYKRMKGFNVLHPMGYDAFGLPAEQYAVEHGVRPRITTERNIANIERQIRMFGFSYDWNRRLATTDAAYYRWTQWIFLQMFNSWYDPVAGRARPIRELIDRLESGEYLVDLGGSVVFEPPSATIEALAGMPGGYVKFHELDDAQKRRLIDEYRLAYMDEVPVNWCPKLGTVLANEEVTNEGRSDRGDHPVYRRAMKQWMLRITAYAERLLADLEGLDWPEPIKLMQRNWIGRSEGANVFFRIAGVSPAQAFVQAAESTQRRPTLSGRGFKGMDPYPNDVEKPADIIEYVRKRPHVELPGATYFAAFSAVRGRKLASSERDIVMDACRHWHGNRCCVTAIVVMDDHVHLLLRPYEGHSLGEILQSIKSFSSHEINKARSLSGSVWEGESFDHVVRDGWWFTKFVYYMCDNPVVRGLCDRFDEYEWLWVNEEEALIVPDGKPFGNSAAQSSDRRRDACDTTIEVFTTRPDTLFGATYMVLAPEHPLVDEITTDAQRQAVRNYVAEAAHKSEMERTAEAKEKTGVFTGAYALNPVFDESDPQARIPIWIADYVMMGYGTGAIMAVPAHDTRDLEFAETFGLPVIQVVQPPESTDWRGYVGDGTAVNSGQFTGLPTAEFKKRITEWLEQHRLGRKAVNYKLRDWLFSRQRYWGEPFPIVHCGKCGALALPEDSLPLELPEISDFTPAASDDPDAPPAPPLGKLAEWAKTACPVCRGPATRELNTMPQWAGSCWYYLRYLDPHNGEKFVDPAVERYWMGSPQVANRESRVANSGGVDLYVGGAEHAVLHLLYARFWHKVLYDLGFASTPEPFQKLFNQGMIRSFAYRDSRGVYIGYDQIDFREDGAYHRQTGEKLAESVEKMSKSLKNVVNPDDVIARYGADAFRLYEMFMGPLEASKPWNTRDVPGVHRFLQRVWRMLVGTNDQPPLLADGDARPEVEKALHKLIKKVGDDIEAMKFNTAIAAMMEFVNTAFRAGAISKAQSERFVLVLAPFAPHIAEELWQKLGRAKSLAYEPWPAHDPAMLAEATIELPVQVNGKLRGRIAVPADADEEAIVRAALSDAKVAAAVEGKAVVKKIVVPGRLVNIVVK